MHWACYVALVPKTALVPQQFTVDDPFLLNLPVAWFDQNYLHLTVLYLGWLDRSQAQKIANYLTHFPDFPRRIYLSGKATVLGVEPDDLRFVALLSHSTELRSWRNRLIASLPIEVVKSFRSRPFFPHISLGRVMQSFSLCNEIAIREQEIAIDGCALMESTEAQRVIMVR
jgi:2'-5' RNA ligase